jgi:hypothetical protein
MRSRSAWSVRRRPITAWLSFGSATSFTRLDDGELVLNIEPRNDGAAVLVNAHSLADALAQAKALLESY